MNMNQQQRLLTLIWNNNPASLAEDLAESGFDIRGINIYRKNLLANAQRALSITFPTIFKLLDSDVSKNLVQQFLKLCPPDQGDWAQWGEEFLHFIGVNQIAHDYPYLTDCAELDWHLHRALNGKDQTLEYVSLALLGSAEPENISIILNQNIALIETKFPLKDIFNAHHHPQQLQRENAMEQAKAALTALRLTTASKAHTVMVSRPEFQPKVTILTDSEAEFLLCLNAGKSLAESLNAVSRYHDFSFEKWLIAAIEENLISYIKENSQ